jgi:hypothetical protein
LPVRAEQSNQAAPGTQPSLTTVNTTSTIRSTTRGERFRKLKRNCRVWGAIPKKRAQLMSDRTARDFEQVAVTTKTKHIAILPIAEDPSGALPAIVVPRLMRRFPACCFCARPANHYLPSRRNSCSSPITKSFFSFATVDKK